ncbi:MAG: hypothetical protein K2N81_10420 [Acetatifactor sp.]|nr:hypothetical protein [Acetatifactor sp.]
MRKLLEHCAAVLGRVIFIGFGIQIALGILWMCNAFARLERPGESIVCVCQIAALGAAVYFFAGSVRGRVFAVLSVLTFPMVLQCLVIPDMRVFASALLISETGCVLRAMEQREGRRFLYAGLCAWLAASLLRGEYLYIGAVPMVFSWLYDCVRFSRNRGESEDDGRRQRTKGLLYRLLLLCAVAGLAAGIGSFYQSREKLLTHLTSRVVWTTLYNTYSDLPKETRVLIKYWDLVNSTYEATGIETILRPSLEEHLGEREAEMVLRALIKTAWQNGRGQILKETVWDMAGYMAAPAVLPLQLQGRAYESYSGSNYLQILKPAPKLGRFYMEYCCKWLMASSVLGLLTGFAVRAKRRLRAGSAFVIPFLTALEMSVGYTLSGAGRMDYKNTLFVLCVWVLWAASAGARGVMGGRPDEKER